MFTIVMVILIISMETKVDYKIVLAMVFDLLLFMILKDYTLITIGC